MHRLILMRHAQAEAAPSGGGGDVARGLSPTGRSEALLIGRTLAQRGLTPDLALVSSAARTRETWELMHDAFGDVEVRTESALYNASTDLLRRFVEANEEQAGCMMILAHNPGVHLLALEYLTESAASPAQFDRLSGGFWTAAAALFTVDVAGRCAYEGFLTPQDVA